MAAAVLLSHLRRLTVPQIEELLARDHVVRRAQQYFNEGRVEQLWVDGDAVRAHVSGSSSTSYHGVVRLHQGQLEPECSCPYTRGMCWHVGAMLLSIAGDESVFGQLELQARGQAKSPLDANEPESPMAAQAAVSNSSSAVSPSTTNNVAVAVPDNAAAEQLRDRLLALPKEWLANTLAELSTHDPLIQSQLTERVNARDSLDIRLFRQAARAALRPGSQLSRFEVPRVAADLEEIAGSIGRLVRSGHPETALDLIVEMASLAWHRLDSADDRDGALSAVVRRLLEVWTRGWAEVPSRDRQSLARELFGWLMEDAGGMTVGLVRDAKLALGPIGLETLASLLRPVLERRLASRPAHLDTGQNSFDPVISRVRSALRETAEARGQLDEYLSLCDPAGLDGAELVASAERFAHAGQVTEALRWLESGRPRTIGSARAALEDLRVALLVRLDRRREANEVAWQSFAAEPSPNAFRRLLATVAENERGEWRRRALDHAEAAADASAYVDVCMEAEDIERLVHRLDAEPAFVLSAEAMTLMRAATRLDAKVPWATARFSVQLASRHLADGNARRYDEARALLAQAKRAFLADGNNAAWEEVLQQLAQAHAVVRTWQSLL